MDEITNELNQIFRRVFNDKTIEITDAMTAQDIAEWDSLNHINLIVAIEKQFAISFTTREVMSFQNVGDLIKSIRGKKAG